MTRYSAAAYCAVISIRALRLPCMGVRRGIMIRRHRWACRRLGLIGMDVGYQTLRMDVRRLGTDLQHRDRKHRNQQCED